MGGVFACHACVTIVRMTLMRASRMRDDRLRASARASRIRDNCLVSVKDRSIKSGQELCMLSMANVCSLTDHTS